MIIPSFIPAEFIKIKNASLCIGISSTSLAHFAINSEILTYSLLNLYEFNNNNDKNIFKNYLIQLSDNKIKYFKDFLDFENVIKKIHI
jgi:hypothetical protein